MGMMAASTSFNQNTIMVMTTPSTSHHELLIILPGSVQAEEKEK
jgi:hypothetical protein